MNYHVFSINRYGELERKTHYVTPQSTGERFLCKWWTEAKRRDEVPFAFSASIATHALALFAATTPPRPDQDN